MNVTLVELLHRAVVPAAERLQPGSMALLTADLVEGAGVRPLPIVVLKGDSAARLCPAEPAICLAVVETAHCPVFMFAIHIDGQTRGFAATHSVLVAMHTAEQRSLLRILGNADDCLYVAMSGSRPTLAFSVGARPELREQFTAAWHAVSEFPLNPQADTAEAAACAGFTMSLVADDILRRFFPSSNDTPPPDTRRSSA